MYRSEIIDDQIFSPDPEPRESRQRDLLHLAHASFGMRHMTADTPVLDCTSSMEQNIRDATNKMGHIIDTIVSDESIDVRFALIEYRDHPPQAITFTTRVQGFTNRVAEMKQWLDQCTAEGGGDGPEAVADALNEALNLSWRAEAAKICIIISDAPPHGVEPAGGDTFLRGCPCGHDPMIIVRQMAAKYIILYTVGVEPSIELYRPYFQTLAQTARGEYVPLANAERLASMIIAGICELPAQAT